MRGPSRSSADVPLELPATFKQTHWSKKHLVGRIGAAPFARLAQELAGFEVATLVLRHTGAISAWFESLDGRFQSMQRVAPQDALRLYDAGFTLFLHQVPSTSLLRDCRALLAAHLDIAGGPQTFDLFASRKGTHTRAHFDQLENFTFQLSGRKRWRLARNRHVARPTGNWVTGKPVASVLELYARTPLPSEMPRPATKVLLEPGEFLYLPRGFWHATETLDDSLSIFLGFPCMPWAQLVTDALRALLLRDEDWRGSASGGAGSDGQARLASLLAGLPDKVLALSARDLLPSGERVRLRPSSHLRRNPIVTLGVPFPSRPGAKQIHAVVTRHGGSGGSEAHLELRAELQASCHHLNRLTGALTVREIAARCAPVPGPLLRALLESLVQHGFFHLEGAREPKS